MLFWVAPEANQKVLVGTGRSWKAPEGPRSTHLGMAQQDNSYQHNIDVGAQGFIMIDFIDLKGQPAPGQQNPGTHRPVPVSQRSSVPQQLQISATALLLLPPFWLTYLLG